MKAEIVFSGDDWPELLRDFKAMQPAFEAWGWQMARFKSRPDEKRIEVTMFREAAE